MDFAKYVSMLKEEAVHFARLDTLEDPFEGSLSRAEYEHWQRVAQAGETKGDLPREWIGRYFDVLMGSVRRARKEYYVSCWHVNRVESEAMWKHYSSSGYAIAVRSTYQRLTNSLPSTYELSEHIGPFLGIVIYADHQAEVLPQGNGFHAIMHKRLSFQHENECRAVIWRAGPSGFPEGVPETRLNQYPPGIKVSAILESLVENIVVSPSAPTWFLETVADVTNRYGYSFPIEKSALTMTPYL